MPTLPLAMMHLCHMGVNQLEVVDITDLAHPTLKVTVPMTNPHGIGIDNKKLFICDKQDGLKVYNATDVMQIANNQLAHFSNYKFIGCDTVQQSPVNDW